MRKKKKFLWFFIFFVILAAIGVYFYFAERESPLVVIRPYDEFINSKKIISVGAEDYKSGLKKIDIFLIQGGYKITALSKKISGHVWNYNMNINSFPFKDGELLVTVTAYDRSWTNLFRGNRVEIQRRYILDNIPPSVSLESYNRYVYQGGTGVVVFKSNEPLKQAGVAIKDLFFPAYKHKNYYICFYTFPYNLNPSQYHPYILVKDRASNFSKASIPCILKKKRYFSERINISSSFLNRKMIQFTKYFPKEKSLLGVFLKVNNILRSRCREDLRRICANSSDEILWSGRFLRQPGSKRMSGFAVKRFYFFQGKKIDEQTHLGIDLASVANAKILASNKGKVVFADFLGIYGKVVIIDHGMGVFTLYGHLSSILVKKGDVVKKGDIIGISGDTGLAGGDHLHFAVLISGIPTEPIEWWDGMWIKNNILPSLRKVFQ